MWGSLRDPAESGLRNFRIAAGLDSRTGPSFMDGDLYKWLEAAIADLELHGHLQLAEPSSGRRG